MENDLVPDGRADPSLDRYARIVMRALGVPVALVSIVEEARQVFPGAVGLPAPIQARRASSLSYSFCQYVVKEAVPLVVSDARQDPRLKDSLAIDELGFVSYAGWPLTDGTEAVIGSLCAIDSVPRVWSAQELDALQDLAAACSSELAQREFRRSADAAKLAAIDVSHRARTLLLLSEGLARTRTLADIAGALLRVAIEGLDCNHAGIWLADDSGTVSYVDHPALPWPQAERTRELSADKTNPIGAVSCSGSPLFYRDRAEQDVDFPVESAGQLLPGEGQARAILPLRAGNTDLGALALLWPGSREFTGEERITIAALAAYTAQAVQRALLLQGRVDTATTLQAAMLGELSQIPGYELVARYLPANAQDQVGGDWYDAVVLPSGIATIMIGDVTGHDIHAAAAMGQLRWMLRGFAWALDDTPAAQVTRLDQAARDLGVERSASLIFALLGEQTPSGIDGVERVAPRRRTLTWANAGHLPPLLIDTDGSATFLGGDDSADVMLGVMPNKSRRDHTAVIPDGATLLLYTDGLIERRAETIDEGMRRLADLAVLHRHDALEIMVDTLIDELANAYPDDVAILALRSRSA